MRNVSTGSWTIRREYDSGEARKSVINRGSRLDSASLAILKRIDDLESFIQTTVVSAPSVPVGFLVVWWLAVQLMKLGS